MLIAYERFHTNSCLARTAHTFATGLHNNNMSLKRSTVTKFNCQRLSCQAQFMKCITISLKPIWQISKFTCLIHYSHKSIYAKESLASFNSKSLRKFGSFFRRQICFSTPKPSFERMSTKFQDDVICFLKDSNLFQSFTKKSVFIHL